MIAIALAMATLAANDAVANPTLPVEERPRMPLAGEWQFALDPDDRGLDEAWHMRDHVDTIQLPGSVVENGYGHDITVDTRFRGHIFHEWYESPRYAPYREPGNIKIPSFLQPPKHYVGPAWYSRDIHIPEAWGGREVELFLERCQFETMVWVNGTEAGSRDSLSTPHVYRLGRLDAGAHRIVIRVDNRCHINVGVAHAVNDWIQTNWNGIVGTIELRATPTVRVADLQAYPHAAQRSVVVRAEVLNLSPEPRQGTLEFLVYPEGEGPEAALFRGTKPFFATRDTAYVEMPCHLGESAALWDEFTPNLYTLEARLASGDEADVLRTTFGLRDIGVDGSMFTVNGRPTMLRGTHEAGLFPLTGYAAMDRASWDRVIARCKEFGLNHMRFHSWCPPRAAFEAADAQGFYFQVEGPFNGEIGDGKPVDTYLREELERILQTYGNHPSFVLMAHGNEPLGDGKEELLAREVAHWKSIDNRRLYTAGSGWPHLPENEFHSKHTPRLQLWGEGLQSRINAMPPDTRADFSDLYDTFDRPAVIHESGQWCVYPNFDEMEKYTGVLKPRNFEIFRDFLEQNHMGHLARDFLMASGKLQVICYKEETEHTLRTPGCAGFQILDINDYSGQGSAIVGVLDPFWDPKPYIDAETWRRFCSETVPLARMEKRVWTRDERFEADLQVTHFGAGPLSDRRVYWRLESDKGENVRQGAFDRVDIPLGHAVPIGRAEFALAGLPAPARYRLVLGIEGSPWENDWDLWVYPAQPPAPTPEEVLVTETLDDAALARLREGGKVLLMPDPRKVSTPAKIGFSNMFWNVSFTGNQAPHTLGILCDPTHPVFEQFPTDYHTNWQWWDLVRRGAAIVVDAFPPELDPLVRPIDNWFHARRLSLLFEARVEGGSLVVCTMDLRSDLEARPAARQLRRSLLDYMASGDFAPGVTVAADAVREVLAFRGRESALQEMGARVVEVSAEVDTAPAKNIIDGFPDTVWLSNRQYDRPYPPHHVVIDMGRETNIAGIVYLPRQDVYGGRVGDYEVYAGTDLESWGSPAAKGRWPDTDEEQRVLFPEPRRARYLKLVAKNEVHGWTYVSVAELDVIVDWRE